MYLLLLSFLSWALTVLAPCVLPMLPVILSGTFLDTKNKYTPYIIIASLSFSLMIFSIFLKVSSFFIWLPQDFWKYFSWILIILLWLTFTFPLFWSKISSFIWFEKGSQELLSEANKKRWLIRNILIGFSLWPIFSSCSPTYLLILSFILPANFFEWILYLVAYIGWLSLTLLCIALVGKKLINRIKWATDPQGLFKKSLWVLLIIVWIAIITWIDKQIETKLLDTGICKISGFENAFIKGVKK